MFLQILVLLVVVLTGQTIDSASCGETFEENLFPVVFGTKIVIYCT